MGSHITQNEIKDAARKRVNKAHTQMLKAWEELKAAYQECREAEQPGVSVNAYRDAHGAATSIIGRLS